MLDKFTSAGVNPSKFEVLTQHYDFCTGASLHKIPLKIIFESYKPNIMPTPVFKKYSIIEKKGGHHKSMTYAATSLGQNLANT